MVRDVLYLGSESRARQHLLDLAQIQYRVLAHGSDERREAEYLSFDEEVLAIARHKMQTIKLPDPLTAGTEYLFGCTADTLIRNPTTGRIFEKPIVRADAGSMLTEERTGAVQVVTGCSLKKFVWREGAWRTDKMAHWTNSALVEFCVDQDSIDRYLQALPIALHCSGAGVVEDHGLSYLKSINGSYTAVIGLPLYELRQELKKMVFKF